MKTVVFFPQTCSGVGVLFLPMIRSRASRPFAPELGRHFHAYLLRPGCDYASLYRHRSFAAGDAMVLAPSSAGVFTPLLAWLVARESPDPTHDVHGPVGPLPACCWWQAPVAHCLSFGLVGYRWRDLLAGPVPSCHPRSLSSTEPCDSMVFLLCGSFSYPGFPPSHFYGAWQSR